MKEWVKQFEIMSQHLNNVCKCNKRQEADCCPVCGKPIPFENKVENIINNILFCKRLN